MMKFGVVKTFCLCVVCNRECFFISTPVLRRRVVFFVADKSTPHLALVVFVVVVVGVFMSSSCL